MTYKNIRWPLIIIVVLIFFGLNYMWQLDSESFPPESYRLEYDSTYKQFEHVELEKLNDSLPYYLYRTKQEWIEKIRNAKKLVYNGNFHSSTTFCFMGVYGFNDNNWYENEEMVSIEKLLTQYDSLAIEIAKNIDSHTIDKLKVLADKINNSLYSISSKKTIEFQKEKKGYFAIPVKSILYTGIEDFFIQNGKNKIVYYDTAFSKDSDFKKIRKLKVREIPVRLIIDKNLVLIPISNKYFAWIDNIFYFISITCSCFLLSFMIVMPIKILWNISKGDAFNPVNSKIFFLIAKVILTVFVILLLLKIITQYSFNHLIPKEIVRFGVMDMMFDNFTIIFYAIAAFILGKAFKKGQSIQDENKLTI